MVPTRILCPPRQDRGAFGAAREVRRDRPGCPPSLGWATFTASVKAYCLRSLDVEGSGDQAAGRASLVGCGRWEGRALLRHGSLAALAGPDQWLRPHEGCPEGRRRPGREHAGRSTRCGAAATGAGGERNAGGAIRARGPTPRASAQHAWSTSSRARPRAQLAADVAAVSALGARWCDQPRAARELPVTPPAGAAHRPRMSVPSCEHSGGTAGGAQGRVGQGPDTNDPKTGATLMNMLFANATAVLSTAALADARDTAQACIEDLRQPNGSRLMSRGQPRTLRS